MSAPDTAPMVPVPPKTSVAHFLRSMLAGGLVGAAVAVGVLALHRSGVFDPGRFLELPPLGAWDLLALAGSALAAVLLHELGHLLGGLRGGMRLLMLAMGPLRITRGRHGLQVSRHSLRHGILGFVSMLPDPARPFVPQFRNLAAGGPLASLACVMVAALLAVPLDGRAEFHAFGFAAFSAIALLMTAIPMRVGGMETDGAQLLDLARGGIGTQVKALLLGLAGQSISGVRPRDLDATLIARGLALVDGGDRAIDPALAAFLHLLAALRADDLGDTAAWDRHMAVVAQHANAMQPAVRAQFAVELACHAARGGDVAAARGWLQHAAGGIVEHGDRKRAEAAIAVLDHRHDDARHAIDAARASLSRSIDPGGALWAADQLDRLEARLER